MNHGTIEPSNHRTREPWNHRNKKSQIAQEYGCCRLMPDSKKIKRWPLSFPAKQNPNMAKALFDWPIVLQYDVIAKYRLISRKFSGVTFFHPERWLNQPKAARICIRSINQSNRSISVRLLFGFIRALSFHGHTKIALGPS